MSYTPFVHRFTIHILCAIVLIAAASPVWTQQQAVDLLYAGVPNNAFANWENYGGVGVLVFDVKNGHRFVKRIPTWKYAAGQQPEAIRGISASVATGLLYLTTPKRLAAIDLKTEKIVWEQTYDGECCDRMTVSPDGKMLYVPGNGGSHWYAVDAMTGSLIKTLPTPKSDGAHNTIWSIDGSRVFMSGQR